MFVYYYNCNIYIYAHVFNVRIIVRIFPKYLLAFVVLLSINSITFAEDEWILHNPKGTAYQLNDVCFVDSLTGWAVGYNGTIFST